MNKKILILISFVVLFQNSLFALHYFSLRGKLTYNYFNAGDLKYMHDHAIMLLRNYNIPARALQSFPPYYGLQVQLLIPVKDSLGINAGVYLEQFSTGVRMDYKDYSGEERLDQILQGWALGLMGEKDFKLNSFISWNLNLGISFISASFETKALEQLYDYRSEESLEFSNFTVGITPGAGLSFNLYNFNISGTVGYMFCLPSTFQYEGETVKKTDSGDPMMPGLDGLRLSAGLGYGF
ncbi:MAG TPA: hypothetical protein VHO03_10360 [Ignavibacteriales bacterium]|nr:hypothetical protein [Ignavibacteriales bacterium]